MTTSLIRLLVVLLLSLAAAAPARGQTSWRLAGTFNGWDASDDAWALAPEREGAARWMIDREFAAGDYYFQFARDGVWPEGALGKGSTGASLIEGGPRILMRIPGDGLYRVLFNPEGRTWSLHVIKGARTVFDARLLGTPIDGRQILLDLSRTLTVDRWDRGMFTYEAPAERLLRPQALDRNGQRLRFTLSGTGPMKMTVRLTDGGQTYEKHFEINVEPAAMLRYSTAEDPNTVRNVALEPVGPSVRRGLVAFAAETVLSALEVSGGEGEVVRQQNARVPAGVYAVEVRDGAVVTQRDPDLPLMLLPGRWRAFTVTPPEPALTMHLTGDFNRWARPGQPGAIEMSPRSDGSFFTIVDLPLGEQRYRYLADGVIELVEGGAADVARGPGGTAASRILVGPSTKEFAPVKADSIDRAAVMHDPGSALDFTPISRRLGLAEIGLSTLPGDVERVTLTIEVADGPGRRRARVPMVKRATTGGFERWSARVMTGEPQALYSFALVDGKESFETPGFSAPIEPPIEPASWALGATWYEARIACFRDGEAGNNALGAPRGDLQGLAGKFEHLRELGIETIVLSGLFDPADLRHVDPSLALAGNATGEELDPATWNWTASDRYFIETCLPAARKNGLRVVVDADLSSVMRSHFAFSDVERRGRESEFASWFFAKFDDAGRAVSWLGRDGYAARPMLRFQPGLDGTAPLWEHLAHVTRRWMDPDGNGDPSDGIDGWRVRSFNEVDDRFWRFWRGVARSINPDAVVIADVEGDASASIGGGLADAAMGRAFDRAAGDWLGNQTGMTERALEVALADVFDDSPHSSAMTPTVISAPLKGRESAADAFAALHVGAPLIYAGTEMGAASPRANPCTLLAWDESGREHARSKSISELLRLRADPDLGPVLRYGAQRSIDSGDPGVFAFERSLNDVRIAVAISRREQPYPAGAIRRAAPGGPATIEAGKAAWWRVADR